MFIKTPAALALGLSVTLALTACGGASNNNEGGGSGDGGLVVGASLVDRNLDPADITSASHQSELAPIYDTLIRLNPDGELEPGLATEWEVVDARTITATLRPDVEFSDGTPVDGEAVRANFERMFAVDTGEMNPILASLDEVEVVSESDVTFHLTRDVAGEFLGTLYGPESLLVSPEQFGDEDAIANEPIGAGPYEVTEFVPNQRIVLQRKDDHWDAANWPVEELTFQNVEDGAPLVTALASGAIDFARSRDASVIESLQKTPSVTVETLPGDIIVYMNFCKSRAPLDDVDVRRAISTAINRDDLVQAATAGEGSPAYQLFREDSPFYNPDAVDTYDPAAAEKLLAGKSVDFELLWLGVLTGAERMSEVVQAQLKEVGVTSTIKRGETSAELYEPRPDSVLTGTSRLGLQRLNALGPDSIENLCGYLDPRLDELTATVAAADPSSQEAVDAWHEIAAIIHDEALLVPLIFQPSVTAFNESTVESRAFASVVTDWRFVSPK